MKFKSTYCIEDSKKSVVIVIIVDFEKKRSDKGLTLETSAS